MAAIKSMACQRFHAFPFYNSRPAKSKPLLSLPISSYIRIADIAVAGFRNRLPTAAAVAMTDDINVLPVQSEDSTDEQVGVGPLCREEESGLDQAGSSTSQIGGFAFQSGAGVGGGDGVGFSLSSSTSISLMEGGEQDMMVDRAINASIVLAAGTFAITKLLTIDMDYWLGGSFGLAHLITYGVIPVEQRLLWVDCVELIWVMILSTYSNEKSEARHSEAMPELSEESQSAISKEMAK